MSIIICIDKILALLEFILLTIWLSWNFRNLIVKVLVKRNEKDTGLAIGNSWSVILGFWSLVTSVSVKNSLKCVRKFHLVHNVLGPKSGIVSDDDIALSGSFLTLTTDLSFAPLVGIVGGMPLDLHHAKHISSKTKAVNRATPVVWVGTGRKTPHKGEANGVSEGPSATNCWIDLKESQVEKGSREFSNAYKIPIIRWFL
ncbi:hypothetical protein SCA6_007679 [Theobroma cacao]